MPVAWREVPTSPTAATAGQLDPALKLWKDLSFTSTVGRFLNIEECVHCG